MGNFWVVKIISIPYLELWFRKVPPSPELMIYYSYSVSFKMESIIIMTLNHNLKNFHSHRESGHSYIHACSYSYYAIFYALLHTLLYLSHTHEHPTSLDHRCSLHRHSHPVVRRPHYYAPFDVSYAHFRICKFKHYLGCFYVGLSPFPDWGAIFPYWLHPKYCIHRNFCEEKDFANFATRSNFYHANFLSCVKYCIEDIATLTTLVKIHV